MIGIGVVDGALTRELRRQVLRPELGPDDPLPGDELDQEVIHIAAVDDDGTVLSTCFVYRDLCPWRPEAVLAYHLRQMATAPESRGQGLGAGVLREALSQVRRRKSRLVWCDARVEAVPFYERWGFETYGPVFTDDRHPIPHRRMHRELRRPPTSSEK